MPKLTRLHFNRLLNWCNLFCEIIEFFKKSFFFVVVIATGEPYGCGKKTEVIDFLKNNEQNELLLDMPPCYGCAGELIQVSFSTPCANKILNKINPFNMS